MAKKKRPSPTQLPNAPLAEVVFELRWTLQGEPPLTSDPGVLPLIDAFTKGIAQLGYSNVEDRAQVQNVLGASVVRRFRKGDQEFPIMQIGPGIYAANDGPTYEWTRYRDQVLEGCRVLLASYPRLPGEYALSPSHLEIRYIDFFDETMLDTAAFKEFLSLGTAMSVQPPPFLEDPKIFEPTKMTTRILLNSTPRGWDNTVFVCDFGSAVRNETGAFRLESKVLTTGSAVPKLTSHNRFLSDLEKWLEFARGLTSPFFKSFIKPALMTRFETKVS